MTPVERALVTFVRWVVPALIIATVLGFGFAPVQASSAAVVVQLGLIALWGVALSARLVSGVASSDHLWFPTLSASARRLSTAVGMIGLSTFGTMLVTLASSAALRWHPSTQFLQLISTADIAWVVAGVMVGLAMRTAKRVWLPTGIAVAAICTWSMYRYLSAVGFGPEGEWIVRATELWRLIIPFDIAAAAMALVAVWYGIRARTASDQQVDRGLVEISDGRQQHEYQDDQRSG
ncbi:MAG: hypothetical protein HKO76_02910 [Acidimicrobiia bacterium]|nr:hypothetical protein [Acidimicrobiia bacterium]